MISFYRKELGLGGVEGKRHEKFLKKSKKQVAK
jgi:hypothetical protein